MGFIISYWREKIKIWLFWLKSNELELSIVLIIILTSTFSYGLGRLSKIKELREPITIENAPLITQSGSELPTTQQGIIASKKGTKYYLPQCYGATIKPENIIIFRTAAEAQKAGYQLAAACK